MLANLELKEEELLTRKEVARRLQVCETTLDKLVRDGSLAPPIRQGRRWVRFRTCDVDAYVDRLMQRQPIGESA